MRKGRVRTTYIIQMMVLTFLLVFLLAWSQVAAQMDRYLYDVGLRLFPAAEAGDVVIVAIDKKSLETLGRWPFSRSQHAALIRRICDQKPKVIGLDILFSEESHGDEDAQLAHAMEQCGRVVLPVVIEPDQISGGLSITEPVSVVRSAAAGIGRVGIVLDPDGIARSADIKNGSAGILFGEQMMRVAGEASFLYSDRLKGDGLYFRFVGGPGSIQSISYADVMEGRPTISLEGKYVLVGATAMGLGDFIPTPFSAGSFQMPGVEIQANLLNALLHRHLIAMVPVGYSSLICALLAIVPFCWLRKFSPLTGALASIGWGMLIMLITVLMSPLAGVWVRSASAVISTGGTVLVWNLGRVHLATQFMRQELASLRTQLGERNESGALDLEEKIYLIQEAKSKLRKLEEQRNDALSFISHDLRSPLSNALLKLSQDTEVDKQGVSMLIRRSLLLAEQFVGLFRAESTDSKLNESIDILAISYQAMDSVFEKLASKELRLGRSMPDEPLWVLGDFSLLERAFINLMDNAVNYSPRDSSIQVTLEKRDTHVRFSVSNVGEIGGEKRERLFQKYQRNLHEGGEANPMSNGIGLFFVKVVAEKHGGEVGLDSEEGIVRFWISLPLH